MEFKTYFLKKFIKICKKVENFHLFDYNSKPNLFKGKNSQKKLFVIFYIFFSTG